MCYLSGVWNWWSVTGNLFDLVGFLIVAGEWYIAMKLQAEALQLKSEVTALQYIAHSQNRPDLDRPDLAARIDAANSTLDGWRSNLFLGGLILVVIGFALQVIGSWPC